MIKVLVEEVDENDQIVYADISKEMKNPTNQKEASEAITRDKKKNKNMNLNFRYVIVDVLEGELRQGFIDNEILYV